MLVSLGLIFLIGMLLGWIFQKIRIPSLLGMIVTGILLGPYGLNLLDDSILGISLELRQIALIIILMRAGLSLKIEDLKKVGRPAILLCFLPACFELVGMIVLAPKLLDVTVIEAAVMGTVVAAVSPAVIVPKMLYLIENGYGVKKSIPQMILAGASVDDIFVIVLFTAFTKIAQGNEWSILNFIQIPISILLGICAGGLLGFLCFILFQKFRIRDSAKIMILLSISFLLVSLEESLKEIIPFSGLLAVMSIGIVIQQKKSTAAKRLSAKYSKLWVAAELVLFVLIGAAVDIQYAAGAGIKVVLLLLEVIIFRMAGVYCCLIKTKLNQKEQFFCMIAYLPKATVQAAIGGIPLAMGLECGSIVLTVAVLAILITAPLGAFGIDLSYKKLLTQDKTRKEKLNSTVKRKQT